jgi:F-type H+-transporting ATPase subunit b
MLLKNINTISLSLLCALLIASPAFAEEAVHEAAEHGGGLPQFDPTSWPSQVFWLAVFFTLLYFVFGKLTIPTLGKTIETRASYIAEHIKKAEALSAEAEILKNEVNAAYKAAGHTASVQITEAETVAKAKLASALTDFRNRYEQQVATTEQNINSAKQSAMADMEQIVVALASQAAEKIAGIPASESGAEGVVKSLRKVA